MRSFEIRVAKIMLISYNIMIGIATIICEIKFGGVIKAAKINMATMACLRYFFKTMAVMMSNFAKK